MDQVVHARGEAGGQRCGHDLVWGVKEGDRAYVVELGDLVHLFGDKGKEAGDERGVASAKANKVIKHPGKDGGSRSPN